MNTISCLSTERKNNTVNIFSAEPIEELLLSDATVNHSKNLPNKFMMLLVIKGGAQCLLNGIEVLLQDNMLYTGNSIDFTDIGEARGYLLYFNTLKTNAGHENLHMFYRDQFYFYQSECRLHPETTVEMDWIISRIINEAGAKKRLSTEIINRYTGILLSYIRMQFDQQPALLSMNSRAMLVKSFFDLLEEHFFSHKTVDYYANRLFVSPKHLTNVIKTESGFPTSWHINQRIILEARRKVNKAGSCLKQIAYELGYDDVSVFSKLFKRITGATFTEYKCSLHIEISRYAGIVTEKH